MSETELAEVHTSLGSIGSGCLGVDRYGAFHNELLYPLGAGPLMPNTFPVIRVSFGQGDAYVRALRVATGEEPVVASEYAPAFLKEEDYRQQVLYPILSGHLRDSTAPLRVLSTCFSPLAPYDHVASVMPCVLLGVRVANPTNRPALCSAMFCMDNLAVVPDAAELPQAYFIRVEPTVNDNRSHMGTSLFRGAIAEAPTELLKTYVRNALLFGDRRNTAADAPPHFCIGARESLDAKLSHGVWDTESPSSCDAFWQDFREKGVLAPPQPNAVARAGAICSTTKIEPGGSYRFDFIFAWHVPPKRCEQAGYVNGYIQHFPNAPESIRYALRNMNYLQTAVSNWQKQVAGSGLPEPFTSALIDSTRAFVTHTRHAPKNGFVLLNNLNNEEDVLNGWDFLRSFALLIFAPRFHAAAVTTALAKAQEQSSDAAQCNDEWFLRHCAEIILSTYADVLYTGNRARFRDWYTRINAMLDGGMHRFLEKIVSGKSGTTLSTETIGIWTAAMNAVSIMTREQGDEFIVQRRDALWQLLLADYEMQLIDMAPAPGKAGAKHVRATAGACFAELLNLNALTTATCIRELLPENIAAISNEGNGEEQAVHTRLLAAVARLLSSRQRPTGEKNSDELTKLLGGIIQKGEVNTNSLGLWPALQALTGVYYDALHHSLVIRPSALAEMNTTFPVFTPVSLGKMDMQIEKGQDLILTARAALDTPLAVESILMRLPVPMRAVRAACVHDAETLTASQEMLPGDEDTRLALRFRTPLKLTGMLTVRLRETTPQQKH